MVELRKRHGVKNAADLLTKHVPRDVMVKHVEALGLEWRTGRSKVAAQLHWVNKKDNGARPARVPLMSIAGRSANEKNAKPESRLSEGEAVSKSRQAVITGRNVRVGFVRKELDEYLGTWHWPECVDVGNRG